MSEPSLSVNPSKPRRITASEMRTFLKAMFRQNREANLIWQISRGLNDPIEEAKDGRFRLNPIWLQLLVLAGLGLATFLYFSFAK